MPAIVLKVNSRDNESEFAAFANLDTGDDFATTWKTCTKVKDTLENGSRLENLSWRLWHLHQMMVETKKMNKSQFRRISCKTTKKFSQKESQVSPRQRAKPLGEKDMNAMPRQNREDVSDKERQPIEQARKPQAPTDLTSVDNQPIADINSWSDLNIIPSTDITLWSGENMDLGIFDLNTPLNSNPAFVTIVDESMNLLQGLENTTNSAPTASNVIEQPLQQSYSNDAPSFRWQPSVASNENFIAPPASNYFSSAPVSTFGPTSLDTQSTPEWPVTAQSINQLYNTSSLDSISQDVVPRHIPPHAQYQATSSHLASSPYSKPTHNIRATQSDQLQQHSCISQGYSNGNYENVYQHQQTYAPIPSFTNNGSASLTANSALAVASAAETAQNVAPDLGNLGVAGPSVPQSSHNFYPSQAKPLTNLGAVSQERILQNAGRDRALKKPSIRRSSSRPQTGPTPSAPKSKTGGAAPPPGGVSQCQNCEATSTPLWRRSDDDKLLCNACGLYYKLHNAHRPKTLRPRGDHRTTSETGEIRPAQCANCETTTTPLWRRDDEGRTLCNACGLYVKLHGGSRPVGLRNDTPKKRQRTKPEEGSSKKRKTGDVEMAAENVMVDEQMQTQPPHQWPSMQMAWNAPVMSVRNQAVGNSNGMIVNGYPETGMNAYGGWMNYGAATGTGSGY